MSTNSIPAQLRFMYRHIKVYKNGRIQEMMMTEIPDDVMKAAGDAILNGGCTLKIGDVMHVSISRAILAERERCAQIAKDAQAEFDNDAIMWIKDGMPSASKNATFMSTASAIIANRLK